MKKLISILLSVGLMVVILSGCSTNNESIKTNNESIEQGDKATEQNDEISIIATIFAPYDFAREVAGDHAEITMLLPPGSESHSYEPTPQDIITIQNSDVFIYVGGESDAWVDQILESMDTSEMKIIALMDCVDIVEEEIVEGMEDGHSHDGEEDGHSHEREEDGHSHEREEDGHSHDGEEDGHSHDGEEDGDSHDESEEANHVEGLEFDEHVWTSPKNAQTIVRKISDTLCELDATNASSYQERTKEYLAQLEALEAQFQAVVDSSKHKTLIFGDRFPFRYFADRYNLDYFAAFPGCSTETEASAATIAFLIDKVKAENIPVVFHAELSNQKMANTINEETGAKVLLLHACHNVTKDEMASGATYLSLMSQNVENLKEALE